MEHLSQPPGDRAAKLLAERPETYAGIIRHLRAGITIRAVADLYELPIAVVYEAAVREGITVRI
jgi:hypothetical protein